MHDPQGLKGATILSRKDDFGYIFCCPNGCVHITIRDVSIRLSQEQYWTLLEMLSESAVKMAEKRPEAKHPKIH